MGITLTETLATLIEVITLKGTWDASAGTFPGAGVAQAGWSFIISAPGTVGGEAFALNDRIVAITDNASTGVYAANWHKLDYTDQVLSVFSRTGTIVAATDDYTWAQIDKTTSDIADFTTKSHTSLSDIGTNTHAAIDTAIQNITAVANNTTFAGNILLNTAGEIQWNATDKLIHTEHVMTAEGFTTWDFGAVTSVGFDGAVEFQTVANANQLYLAAGGQNIMGHNASVSVGAENRFQVLGTGFDTSSMTLARWNATASSGAALIFGKSKTATVDGGFTAVDNASLLGSIQANGDDGVDMATAGGRIQFITNGTTTENKLPTDIHFYTALGTVADDIALSAKLHKDAMLDLYGGTISIFAGAEDGLKTRRDTFSKVMRIASPHKDISEQPILNMYAQNVNGASYLTLGGGDANYNSVNHVAIHATDNYLAAGAGGTEVARFEGGASKALRLGLGRAVLGNWKSTDSVFNIGGQAALSATLSPAVGAGYTQLSTNVYYDTDSTWKMTTTGKSVNYVQNAGAHIFYVGDQQNTNVAINGTGTWTTALTIANDASSTFGGNVSIIEADDAYLTLESTNGAVPKEVAIKYNNFDTGTDYWWAGLNQSDSYAVGYGATFTGSGVKLNMSSGANGLITLSGGTGGVKLDDTVGIGVVPDANHVLKVSDAGSPTSLALFNTNANAGTRNWSIATNQFAFGDVVFMQSNAKDGDPISAGSPALVISTDKNIRLYGDARVDGFINHGPIDSYTITGGGVIVVAGSHYQVTVAGGSGSGADDLLSAIGGVDGDELYLQPTASGVNDTVTVKNGTGAGTFILAGGADFIMDSVNDRLHCIHNGIEWAEVSRSSNG